MINSLLEDNNCAYLISDRKERFYFLQKDVSEGYLLLTQKGNYFYTDSRYYFAVTSLLTNTGVIPKLFIDVDSLFSDIKAEGVKKLFIDYSKTTVSEYNKYLTYGLEICDGEKAISGKRAIKDKTEIENVISACKITESAFNYCLGKIKVGITEIEVGKLIDDYCIKSGATGPSFPTIVAFGENSAIPHHETSNRKLKYNENILIDTGCIYNGYCSDFTRTLFFGNPTEDFIENYNLVLEANLLGEKNICVGEKCSNSDKSVREYFVSKGRGEYFTHSLGHGVGVEIHESPYLSKKGEEKFNNFNVFTIEPGLYFNGKYGIRIEDTVAIINDKPQRLFSDNKQLIVIK